ncbi:MAG: DUF2779 domain-containing protein [Hyphomicrobiales bacterium]
MEKHQLSKSTFIRSVQCQKSLYLHKKRPYLRDRISKETLAKYKRGTEIGIIAQQLFPNGIDLKPKSPSQYFKCIENTLDAISRGQEVIYEAGFMTDGVLVLLDILVKQDDGWHAYEVKSSLSISSTYIYDAALQSYVIYNSGINLIDFSIIYVNADYQFKDELDLNSYFKIQSVFKEVKKQQSFIKHKIREAKRTLKLGEIPDVPIGAQCYNPYVCDFKGLCWKEIKTGSVFDLFGADLEESLHLYNQEKSRIEDLSIEEESVNDKSKVAIQAFHNKGEVIDKDAIKEFLNKISANPFYMCMHTYKQPIPKYQGQTPYERILCQWQIGKLNVESKSFFYGNPDLDYRKEIVTLLEEYKELVESDESIIVYDSTNFKSIFEALKLFSPEHSEMVDRLSSRMIDLKFLFENAYYYHYSFRKDIDIYSITKQLAKSRRFKKPETRSEVLLSELFFKSYRSNDPTEKDSSKEELINNSIWHVYALTQVLSNLYRKIL